MRTFLICLLACAGLTGPMTPAHAGLLSATARVIAILGGELFVGEAEGRLDGTGTVAISAQKDPDLVCRGKFTSSAELGGTGRMVCSDGRAVSFRFQRVNAFRGHGVGSFSHGSMSFAYGYSPAEVGPYLRLPEGKKLAHEGTMLRLADL